MSHAELTDKAKLAYNVIEALLREYTQYPLAEGEEIIAFCVTAHITDKQGNNRRTGFNGGAYELAEAKYRLSVAIKHCKEREAQQ